MIHYSIPAENLEALRAIARELADSRQPLDSDYLWSLGLEIGDIVASAITAAKIQPDVFVQDVPAWDERYAILPDDPSDPDIDRGRDDYITIPDPDGIRLTLADDDQDDPKPMLYGMTADEASARYPADGDCDS